MNQYLWWPAMLVLLCIGSATCTHKSNGGSLWWSAGVVIFSMCFGLLYATFMKRTTNPVLDNLIYCVIITLTVTSTFILFGCAMSFKWEQWIGVCLMMSGLILFNLRF